MIVAIDAVGNKHGGGATVLLDLLDAGREMSGISKIIVFASPRNLRKFELRETSKIRVIDVPFAEGGAGRVIWALCALRQHLRRLKPDVFLGLNGVGLTGACCVSTIFIQQSLPYSPEALSRYPLRQRLRMKIIRRLTGLTIAATNHILVQSEVMKTVIGETFSVNPMRISAFMPSAPVFLEAGNKSFDTSISRILDIPIDLLYVGSDEPHKNLPIVARGLKYFPKEVRPKCSVTLPPTWRGCVEGWATGLGSLGSSDLCRAYRRAKVLVMPSLIESVGLPMLEAMRLGTPVLAADRPYAHAMCEDAAIFFDPLSPQDFSIKLQRLLEDDELRSRLVKRGANIIERRDDARPYTRMLEKVVAVAKSTL